MRVTKTHRSSSTPQRPSLRDAQRALTRTRILDAAGHLFASRGYAATSIDHIAEGAGVSRATYYLHFTSKLEVMNALLEGLLPEVHALYQELLSHPRPSEADVRQFVERFFAFYASHGELISASVQAEAADRTYSHRVETLSWSLVALFAPPGRAARRKNPEQVQALALVEELDRLAYFIEVRGWDVERSVAIDVIAEHWLRFLARRKR